MKVSVIMLTYNREEYVGRAIESILSQTMKSFEFIIVDNGSTDRSGEIADTYAKNDDRIRVIHLYPNINIATGRNAGLKEAKGEYIAFVDDDDIAEPDMIEFLYNLATENDADISICGSTKEVNGKILPNYVYDEKLILTSEEGVVEMLRRKRYNAAEPTKMMKRTLFENIPFNTKREIDDISAMYKYFAEAKRVVAHGVPKYCFWRHPGNISAFTTNDKLWTPERLDEYFTAFRERTLYLSERLPLIADYAQYSEWSYMISMCNKIIKNDLRDCSKQLVYVKKELTEHYDEFYNSPYIEEFEKEFMRAYIK